MLSRRLLVAVVLLMLVPMLSLARPDVVVRAGLVEADLQQDDLTSEARLGMTLGVGTTFPLGAGFQLAPELWWQQRGFEKASFTRDILLEGRTAVISVPVLLAYHFEAVSVDPRAFVGLAADLTLSSEIRREGEDWVDVKDDEGTSDLSLTLVMGGGVRIGGLDLDVRYVQGLSATTTFDYDVFDDTLPQLFDYQDATESTWVFSAGWWF